MRNINTKQTATIKAIVSAQNHLLAIDRTHNSYGTLERYFDHCRNDGKQSHAELGKISLTLLAHLKIIRSIAEKELKGASSEIDKNQRAVFSSLSPPISKSHGDSIKKSHRDSIKLLNDTIMKIIGNLRLLLTTSKGQAIVFHADKSWAVKCTETIGQQLLPGNYQEKIKKLSVQEQSSVICNAFFQPEKSTTTNKLAVLRSKIEATIEEVEEVAAEVAKQHKAVSDAVKEITEYHEAILHAAAEKVAQAPAEEAEVAKASTERTATMPFDSFSC